MALNVTVSFRFKSFNTEIVLHYIYIVAHSSYITSLPHFTLQAADRSEAKGAKSILRRWGSTPHASTPSNLHATKPSRRTPLSTARSSPPRTTTTPPSTPTTLRHRWRWSGPPRRTPTPPHHLQRKQHINEWSLEQKLPAELKRKLSLLRKKLGLGTKPEVTSVRRIRHRRRWRHLIHHNCHRWAFVVSTCIILLIWTVYSADFKSWVLILYLRVP